MYIYKSAQTLSALMVHSYNFSTKLPNTARQMGARRKPLPCKYVLALRQRPPHHRNQLAVISVCIGNRTRDYIREGLLEHAFSSTSAEACRVIVVGGTCRRRFVLARVLSHVAVQQAAKTHLFD